ncbi:MAG: hypothetical protein DRG33_05595 [Deltaproteobacteria bacterium]|nr:MAG: hypothetical protein DRG33_05595 [Deltaproteobacteria bacterium]
MALAYESDNIANEKYNPASAPHSAREVYRALGKVTVGDPLVENDLVGLVVLPANCIPTDIKLICDELTEAGTDIVFDVGILNAAKTDLVPNSLLIEGSIMCQANGGVQDMNRDQCVFEVATWLAEATCPGINEEKIIAMKITTPATTEKAGNVHAIVDYRSAENGV